MVSTETWGGMVMLNCMSGGTMLTVKLKLYVMFIFPTP